MSPRRRDTPPGPTGTARLTDQLRRRILTGELVPGTALREEELAESHGVSRHTLRAALAQLAAERLVAAEPYRGVRVTSFTPDDVLALQQLRAALESEAVRLMGEAFGDRWPESVLEPVRAAIAGLVRCDADDWPAVAAAHAEVHGALVAAAGSPRITEAHRQLHSEMLLLLVHVRPEYTLAGLVTEHERYLGEVQTRGAAAVREHLGHSTDLIAAAHDNA